MHLNKITSLSDTIKSLHAHIETWDLYHAKDDTSKVLSGTQYKYFFLQPILQVCKCTSRALSSCSKYSSVFVPLYKAQSLNEKFNSKLKYMAGCKMKLTTNSTF